MRFASRLLLALLPAVPGLAQGDEAPPVQVAAAYASRYVFRGVERAGDSAQAGVEFSREGWRGGLWTSQPFDRDDAGEVNLHAAYAFQAAESVSIEASVTQSWFDEVPGVKQSLEAGLTATLAPVGGFTPGLAYYHDFRLRADTGQVSLARSVALTKLGAFLEFNIFAGWAHGDDWRPDASGSRRRDGYGYWGGEVHLPYRIGAHSTVIAGLHYADSFGRSPTNGPFGSTSGGGCWITIGVNLDF